MCLNLTGQELKKAALARGAWVLAQAIHRPTARIDVQLKVLPGAFSAIRHSAQVHIHLATSSAIARISVRRGESVGPGETRVVQLVLDRQIGALHGDPFVIREQPSGRTLGGGLVLDPFAPDRHRHTTTRRRALEALGAAAPLDAL